MVQMKFQSELKEQINMQCFCCPGYCIATGSTLNNDVTGSGSTPVHHCNRVRSVSAGGQLQQKHDARLFSKV